MPSWSQWPRRFRPAAVHAYISPARFSSQYLWQRGTARHGVEGLRRLQEFSSRKRHGAWWMNTRKSTIKTKQNTVPVYGARIGGDRRVRVDKAPATIEVVVNSADNSKASHPAKCSCLCYPGAVYISHFLLSRCPGLLYATLYFYLVLNA